MTKLLSFLSWMSVLALWACAACIYINPALYGKYFAVLGLCFPLCATAVVGMGVICILFKPKMVWISVVGLLCAAGSIHSLLTRNALCHRRQSSMRRKQHETLWLPPRTGQGGNRRTRLSLTFPHCTHTTYLSLSGQWCRCILRRSTKGRHRHCNLCPSRIYAPFQWRAFHLPRACEKSRKSR